MITETITRIKTAVTELKLVGGSADFQTAAESNPRVTPAAFVFPMQEEPSSNKMGDIVIQKVTAYLGVVLVVRNVADTRGDAARQDLETYRSLVKTNLLGWQPSADFAPFERGGGRLLAFRDGHMWWQDIYLTSYYDRSSV